MPRLNLSDVTMPCFDLKMATALGHTGSYLADRGLLSLPKPAVRESRVKLMFETSTGPVPAPRKCSTRFQGTSSPSAFWDSMETIRNG